MRSERLDKLLCASGLYTRSEARALIASGRVTVDGTPVRRPETQVGRSASIIAAGQPMDTAEFIYIMLHKPAGMVSASKPEGSLPPVTDLLPAAWQRRGMGCVGRLDADVTGLLLLTDDGAYIHRVTSPRSEIAKTYAVTLDVPVTDADARTLAAGVTLRDGTVYRPAMLEPTADNTALVTVTEGKYHEVKNLMAVIGRRVLAMRRESIGGLRLDSSLPPGGFRRLTDAERDLVFYHFD